MYKSKLEVNWKRTEMIKTNKRKTDVVAKSEMDKELKRGFIGVHWVWTWIG